METILYINMTYDELQDLAKMEDENTVFEYLKKTYSIPEPMTIISTRIANSTILILTLKQL